MRQIYAIGETVLDLIFQDKEPVAAKAGGSMLNAAISLGRLKLPVNFISEFANDKVGDIIQDFLIENNVSDKFVYRFDKGKTALSLAFLDEKADAEYTFYKAFPEKRFDISIPDIQADDIVLFGSFFAITNEIRPKLLKLLKIASEKGAIIIYDPNFRSVHQHQLPELKEYILENISLSHIVRGSDEDFYNIFGSTDSDDAFKEVAKYGCHNLIYTANKNGVMLHTKSSRASFTVNSVKAVSTIGAGDSFNAGIVAGLFSDNIPLSQIDGLTTEEWQPIIQRGIDFGTHVCMSYDNYISGNFAKKNLL